MVKINEAPFEQRTIPALLVRRAKECPDKVILSFIRGKNIEPNITWMQLERNTNRLANGLLAQGVEFGQKVGLMLPNCPELIYLFIGLGKIGAVSVPLNIALKGELLGYQLDQWDCRMLVIDSSLVERLQFLEGRLPKLEKVFVMNGMRNESAPFLKSWKVNAFEILMSDNENSPGIKINPCDPLTIMYTSGTTGPSKGVVKSHHHIYCIGEDTCYGMEYTEKDIIYTCLPLFHGNALNVSTFPGFVANAQVVVSERFSVTRFWEEVRTSRATEVNLLGAMTPILWSQPPQPTDKDHNLRIILCIPVPSYYREFEERFGVTLTSAFGMGEAGMPLWQPLDSIKPNACGKPIPGYEVKIFDENDCEVPPGVSGEIVIRPRRPSSIMCEYYKMPEKTLEIFRNLWLHTGDKGYRDEEDYIFWVDRIKDSIRRRGENISSWEVERVVNQHPKVIECAVTAVPSNLTEDEVKVWVVLHEGQKIAPEELLEWCQERMAYFAVPRYVEFVEVLPKTPSEKIQKNKLREMGLTTNTWDREKAGFKVKR